MEIIHVFGDSHVAMFSGVDERGYGFPNDLDTLVSFRTYNMGPVLAYNFIKKIDKFPEWIEEFNVKRMILYIGEIDVRVWLVKIAESTLRSLSDVVMETVFRYIEGIDKIKKLVDELIVFGPHPQRFQEDGILKDFHYGTYPQIYEAGELFNQYLKKYKPVDIKVFSIFSKIMDQELNKKYDFYADDFHLKSSTSLKLILESMKEEGIQL